MSYDNLRVLFFLLRPLWPIRFPQAICIRPIQQSNYSAGGQFAHERIYARTVVTHGGLTRHVMRPRESKQKAVCLILSCVCARRKADAYPAVVYCTCTVPIDAIASSPYQQQQVYMLLFHVGQRSVHLIQDFFSQLSPFRVDWTGSCGALASGFHLDCQLSSLARSCTCSPCVPAASARSCSKSDGEIVSFSFKYPPQ